ncbi:MAG: PaaI family thioesterase [Clostridia bacterium]|nr:PaaI family thioesterase [Clostridia bacterium]
MKYKVVKKQKTSRMCMVCGQENKFSLKASFYELENESVVAIFKPLQEHQSYPGRLHGGIAGAILDETIGRAMFIKDENVWGVTAELNLKYHKPVPLDEELRVVGRITRDTRRIFEGEGEILLSNGEVAVSASGKYVKIPLEQIAQIEETDEVWETILSEDDPVEIEI